MVRLLRGRAGWSTMWGRSGGFRGKTPASTSPTHAPSTSSDGASRWRCRFAVQVTRGIGELLGPRACPRLVTIAIANRLTGWNGGCRRSACPYGIHRTLSTARRSSSLPTEQTPSAPGHIDRTGPPAYVLKKDRGAGG